jgi:hypothetical protein
MVRFNEVIVEAASLDEEDEDAVAAFKDLVRSALKELYASNRVAARHGLSHVPTGEELELLKLNEWTKMNNTLSGILGVLKTLVTRRFPSFLVTFY